MPLKGTLKRIADREPCGVGRAVLAGAGVAQGKGLDAARTSGEGGFEVSLLPLQPKG